MHITISEEKEFNTWKNILYPNGFNSNNSKVFTQYLGSNAAIHAIIKISDDNTKYSAIKLVSADTSVRMQFLFLKTR